MCVCACARFPGQNAASETARILDILRSNPDVAFSIDRLAVMLGRSRSQIRDAVESLEGPVASEAPGAFVHYWRFTDEAVLLP